MCNGHQSLALTHQAEIMNRIYSFAKEEDKTKFAIKQDPNGTKPAWQFLALAQVCRGIRSEYLPLCRASLNIRVQPKYVYSCLDTFFVPSGVKYEEIVGRLEVAPPGGLGYADKTQEIDLKRLIMLSSVAQDFHVRFSRVSREELYKDEGDGIRDLSLSELMKDMVGMKDWVIFSQYVQYAVQRLVLGAHRIGECACVWLTVEVKASHWKPWMLGWNNNECRWEGSGCPRCFSCTPCREKDIEIWSCESGMVPNPECNPEREAMYISFTTASLQ